jgi:hypothetical protein
LIEAEAGCSELNALVAEIAEAGDSAVALAGDVRDEAFAKAQVELVEPLRMPTKKLGANSSLAEQMSLK